MRGKALTWADFLNSSAKPRLQMKIIPLFLDARFKEASGLHRFHLHQTPALREKVHDKGEGGKVMVPVDAAVHRVVARGRDGAAPASA